VSLVVSIDRSTGKIRLRNDVLYIESSCHDGSALQADRQQIKVFEVCSGVTRILVEEGHGRG